MNGRNLEILRKKIKYYGAMSGGYITPSEAEYLSRFFKTIDMMVEHQIRKKASGNSRPTWVYFEGNIVGKF